MHDVIVIGLGAHGSAVLHELARRGVKVLGVDAWQPPHSRASHGGRTRIIREAYFEHPSYVPLVQRAFTLWEQLEQQSGRQILWRSGGLMLGPQDGHLIAGTLASIEQHGLRCEKMTPEQVHSRWPVFHAAPGMLGIHNPRDGVLLTDAAISVQLELARKHGAQVIDDNAVQSWQASDAGFELKLANGDRLIARRVVACAGPGMSELFRELPLTVTRQVQFWIEPLEDRPSFAAASCPIFICQEEEPDGSAAERFFYGLPDLGSGVKVARHGLGQPAAAQGALEPASDADWQPLRHALAGMLPLLGAGRVTDTTLCRYTNTPDEHFIIDWHPGYDDRLLLCSACSGHGFKFAPAIGEALAQLMLDGAAQQNLSLFSLSRFST